MERPGDARPSRVEAADDLLSMRDHLVGVIDVRRGQCVHARRGLRHQYAPLASVDGEPERLARAYLSLGLSRIYLADLDGIEGAAPQFALMDSIAASVSGRAELLVDPGWRGDEARPIRASMESLTRGHDGLNWIAASESAVSANAPARLSELVGPLRYLAGIDIKGGEWSSTQVVEDAWWVTLRRLQASGLGPRGSVVLDLAAVGSETGPVTVARCRRTAAEFPGWELISGGGIRGASDVRALLDVGCNGCLVATSLQGAIARCQR